MYKNIPYNSRSLENCESFGNWMRAIKRENGKNYSLSTVQAYQTALKNTAIKLNIIDRTKIKMNLFEYDSVDDFHRAEVLIRNAPNYEEINMKSGNGAFTAGMKMYGQYLRIRDRYKSNVISTVKKETVQTETPKKIYAASEACLVFFNRVKKTCEHFNINFTDFIDYFLNLNCTN